MIDLLGRALLTTAIALCLLLFFYSWIAGLGATMVFLCTYGSIICAAEVINRRYNTNDYE